MKRIVESRMALAVSNLILSIGVSIIMLSLGYMIFNITHADSFITTWSVFMGIGVSFSFISVFVRMIIKSSKNRSIAI